MRVTMEMRNQGHVDKIKEDLLNSESNKGEGQMEKIKKEMFESIDVK